MSIPRDGRLHQIDGLRAIAISLVVYHHSLNGSIATALERAGMLYPASLLRYLFGSGVELFFVISGIVLVLPYAAGGRSPDLRATARYYRRRLERLWPPFLAAWAFSGAVILLATRMPTWYTAEILPKFAFADWLGQAFIINLGFPAYNAAWWSLNIEVTFYVVFPLLLLALRALPARWPVLIMILAGSCVVAELAWADVLAQAPVGTPAMIAATIQLLDAFLRYLPCFISGMILAIRPIARSVCLAAIIGGAAYVIVATNAGTNPHDGFAIFYFGLAGWSMQPRSRIAAFLRAPLMVWLGERSYSLFLVHFTVFYAVNYLVSAVDPGRGIVYFAMTRLLGLPLALFAAMILFHLVERPFAHGLTTARMFWPPLRGMLRRQTADVPG